MILLDRRLKSNSNYHPALQNKFKLDLDIHNEPETEPIYLTVQTGLYILTTSLLGILKLEIVERTYQEVKEAVIRNL